MAPSAIFSTPVAYAAPLATSTLMEMAAQTASEYHLDLKKFDGTIQCESGWNPTVQSAYKTPSNELEDSWGLVQINLEENPTVTKQEALDPEFALQFMAKEWVDGNASHWTAYRKQASADWPDGCVP